VGKRNSISWLTISLALLLLVLMVGMQAYAVEATSLQPKRRYTASYVVSIDATDGNKVKVADGTTGIVDYSATDATVAIQYAINALTSGGSILLKQGSYTVNQINLASGIGLAGEPGAVLVSNDKFVLNGQDVSNVTIHGLTINHAGSGNYATNTYTSGIFIESVNKKLSGIDIHDNEIYGSRYAAIHLTSRLLHSGSGDYGFTNVRIANNYVHDLKYTTSTWEGIAINVAEGNSDNITIADNHISGKVSIGIGVGTASYMGIFQAVNIVDNYIDNYDGFGLDLAGIQQSVVKGNYIHTSDARISDGTSAIWLENASLKPSTNLVIENNTLSGSGKWGVMIWPDSHGITIRKNYIERILNPAGGASRFIAAEGSGESILENYLNGTGSAPHVVGVTIGSDSLVQGNHFLNPPGQAVEVVDGSSGTNVANNTIEGRPADNSIWIGTGTHCLVTGNILYNNPAGKYAIAEDTGADYNSISGNTLISNQNPYPFRMKGPHSTWTNNTVS
jgi:hypothetical protein